NRHAGGGPARASPRGLLPRVRHDVRAGPPPGQNSSLRAAQPHRRRGNHARAVAGPSHRREAGAGRPAHAGGGSPRADADPTGRGAARTGRRRRRRQSGRHYPGTCAITDRAGTVMELIFTSNSPGEVATWLAPTLRAVKERAADAWTTVFLVPCAFATGAEVDVVRAMPEADRVFGPGDYWRVAL